MSRLLIGDCRDSMRKLIAEGVKVQMCVTSPPYWGLRDYGVDGQLGLEATIPEFIGNMVEVFGLVRELLADDGTLWLNIGDSYIGGGRGGGSEDCKQRTNVGSLIKAPKWGEMGLKAKDLAGIPWRLAFALQDAGWWLRQDIIWHKPNPMPESIKDRCTKAHEYLFLIAKSERYLCNMNAIAETATTDWAVGDSTPAGWAMGEGDHSAVAHQTAQQHRKVKSSHSFARDVDESPPPGQPSQHRPDRADRLPTGMRNKRSVWTVPSQAYSEAHFATYPPALIEPCILAGSKPGDIVFDPFFGSGTTGEVAQRLGREWIGCELNSAYVPLIERRTQQLGLELTA